MRKKYQKVRRETFRNKNVVSEFKKRGERRKERREKKEKKNYERDWIFNVLKNV